MVEFNLKRGGYEAAEKYMLAVYDKIMEWTPLQRREWLESYGWEFVSQKRTEDYVRNNWLAPKERKVNAYYPQTKALMQQIWWNMEQKGLVVRK